MFKRLNSVLALAAIAIALCLNAQAADEGKPASGDGTGTLLWKIAWNSWTQLTNVITATVGTVNADGYDTTNILASITNRQAVIEAKLDAVLQGQTNGTGLVSIGNTPASSIGVSNYPVHIVTGTLVLDTTAAIDAGDVAAPQLTLSNLCVAGETIKIAAVRLVNPDNRTNQLKLLITGMPLATWPATNAVANILLADLATNAPIVIADSDGTWQSVGATNYQWSAEKLFYDLACPAGNITIQAINSAAWTNAGSAYISVVYMKNGNQN